MYFCHKLGVFLSRKLWIWQQYWISWVYICHRNCVYASGKKVWSHYFSGLWVIIKLSIRAPRISQHILPPYILILSYFNAVYFLVINIVSCKNKKYATKGSKELCVKVGWSGKILPCWLIRFLSIYHVLNRLNRVWAGSLIQLAMPLPLPLLMPLALPVLPINIDL